ncbi:MAG: phosphate ABC transporter permease PstA [Gammaproteobacteria bacterium]|nr:phosphate ABC transporter permease PstA [Gammaproteobacteria bacterium]
MHMSKQSNISLLGLSTWLAAILVMAAFIWITGDIIIHGVKNISWEFVTTAPQQAGRSGGIYPIIISTLWIVGLALAFTLPLGIACALLMNEMDSSHIFTRVLNVCLDLLASMPSIVIGLFGNAFFSIALGMGFSILSGALTLSIMMLPLFILSSYNSIRQIPAQYYQNSFSLKLSKSTLVFRILLPIAMPGIVTGIILCTGRALAETAALLFTSGYVTRMPESVFDSGRSMSIHIYDLAMNVPGGNNNSYTTAFVLIILLLFINSSALRMGKKLGYFDSTQDFTWMRRHA